MSTKIFTGFSFESTSLEGTLFLLGAHKRAIQGLVDAKNRKLLAHRCTRLVDAFCLARNTGEPLPAELEQVQAESAYGHCGWKQIEEQEQCRKSPYRSPEVDCDVTLRLFGDPKTKRIVGFVCEERVGAHEYLLKVPGIVDYSYWNNTDAPKEMSEAEWEERAGIWNRAADTEGFEFDMSWKSNYEFLKDVVPHLPSLEERVRSRSLDQAINEHVSQHWKPRSPGDTSGLFSAVNRAKDELGTEGSPLALRHAEIKRHLEAVLLPELSQLLDTQLAALPAR